MAHVLALALTWEIIMRNTHKNCSLICPTGFVFMTWMHKFAAKVLAVPHRTD